MKNSIAIPFQYLAYLSFRLSEWFIGLFSLRSCIGFGRSVGGLIHRFAAGYRNLVTRNLHSAYPERPSEEIDELTQKHFLSLGGNLMASLRTSLMSNEEIESLVSYEGVEGFQKAIDAGNGVVGALTHTANWELYARIRPFGDEVPFGTIYQALRNPFIDEHIERRRGELGTKLFERRGGFRNPTEFLRNNGALGVLMDQYPGQRGVLAPFFNRLTTTTTLPALLSLRTGAPIMFVGMHPDGDEKWKIVFHDPIYPPADRSEKEAWTLEVTATLNEKLAATVKENPEEWFWVHNRFKTSGKEVFPQSLKLPLAIPDHTKIEEVTPHFFLIRSPNPLGDACMSIPAVKAIKLGRPDAHVTILCRSNLEQLWSLQPEVDAVIPIPGKLGPGKVGQLIRDHRPYFDTGILFPNSTSSGLEMKAGRVPFIYGYVGHHRKRLLRWVIPEPPSEPPTHHLERYLHIVRQLGAIPEDHDRLLSLPPAPSPIPGNLDELRITLCPGAEFGEAKRWPLERYADLIKSLRARFSNSTIEVTIVGSPAEQELGETLANSIDEPRENLAGKTSIGGLIDHLQTRHIVVSNDTGTMHLAAALGIPTVAIFGSTEPNLTSPIGEIHSVIREKVDCSPCFKRTCPIDFRCMTRISVDQVTEATAELIERHKKQA